MFISTEQLQSILKRQQAQFEEAHMKMMESMMQKFSLHFSGPDSSTKQSTSADATAASITEFIYVPLQPDENREIGRNVLLEIPARKLKNGEYFHVPVRVKQLADIAEFTLRCEAPANTYIEFLRVVWPWESEESSLGPDAREADFRQFQLNSAFGAWDISQRHLPKLKGSVIEVVARYREGANAVNMHENYR
ncbi:unnamed protein product [Dibothriocephalus latus]|uniref:Uncharacterized protein n=1 Tax=Dibothriocephalus latus TaxID=60516 RepID=A0A3P6TYC9_DIBLA|nr:unnamed protein product [Dibothriocephalus latus]